MATTCEWYVETLERETETGKILVVHYGVKATDGIYESCARGQVPLEGELTIPYSEITEEIAIGWVQDALANQLPAEDGEGNPVAMSERKTRAINSLEDFLEKQIAEQAAPTVATGTPW